MELQELVKELTQLNNLAKAHLDNIKRRQTFAYEDDECTRCWLDGSEEATEPFENFIDDLSAILRRVDIDETMQRDIAVSDKQLELM